MLTITLLCNLGMSTSMLVDKIIAAAKSRGIEVDVDAVPFDRADERLAVTNILLLGPQVRYHLPKFQKDYGEKIGVIGVIDFTDYALVNGEKILGDALAKYKGNY